MTLQDACNSARAKSTGNMFLFAAFRSRNGQWVTSRVTTATGGTRNPCYARYGKPVFYENGAVYEPVSQIG